MRLLNAHDLHFEEFYDLDIPRYAILSHRWGQEEVSFKEMRKSDIGSGKSGSGWDKIRSTCRLAMMNNFAWVWIDTCCINKDSSAELTEAINSMFKWYERADRCYVYLSDVYWDAHNAPTSVQVERLRRSSWFSRGWTLQELLAPEHVYFYDMDWRYIGAKDHMTLLLAEITKINPTYLRQWDRACVAQKMSWASGRETSRVEDVAYSLLGLFDVNMPLLYGEGRKAFYRLQLEIIKQSDDESIFAWIEENTRLTHTGMLAPWPDAFRFSGTIMLNAFKPLRPPFSMTNKGLEMRIPESVMKEGGYDIHRQHPSSGWGVEVLTLHLACFAMVGNTSSAQPAWAPVTFELQEFRGYWYRRAQRLLWDPHAVRSWNSDFEENLSRLRRGSEKEITIYVRQRELNPSHIN